MQITLKQFAMNTNVCPKMEICPIFKNNVLLNKEVGTSYKNVYCTAGGQKYKSCKRFMLSQAVKVPIPTSILPNNPFSMESLIEKITALHKAI
jgi:hypothetical protein